MEMDNLDSTGDITVTFPFKMEPLTITFSENYNLTCEFILWKCLEYLQTVLHLRTYPKDAGLSVYLAAFGLQYTVNGEEIYLPLHHRFTTVQPYKNFSFRVRHHPPHLSNKLANIVWELIILQTAEDFLMKDNFVTPNKVFAKKLNKLETKELILDLASLALIISNSSPENNYQALGPNFMINDFHFFSYRKHLSTNIQKFLSNTFLPHNWAFDYIDYYRKFVKWIQFYKSENRHLISQKQDFILTVITNFPQYGMESYSVKRKLEDGSLKDSTIQLKINEHNGRTQLNLYLDSVSSFLLVLLFLTSYQNFEA